MYTSLFKKDDVRITQKFSSSHKGLDLSRGVVEQPIYLPNKAVSGTVWKILPSYSTGGVYYPNAPIIYVKHKDGSGSRYIHSYPKNVKVKVGDTVVAGQQICCTGNSGHSFGDHLHFEWLTKWDDLNTRVNPEPYVMNDEIPPVVVPPTPVDPTIELRKRIETLELENRGLAEALAASQGQVKGLEDRIVFLEENIKLRETELSECEVELDRITEERNRFEKEKNELLMQGTLKTATTGEVFAELWKRILHIREGGLN